MDDHRSHDIDITLENAADQTLEAALSDMTGDVSLDPEDLALAPETDEATAVREPADVASEGFPQESEPAAETPPETQVQAAAPAGIDHSVSRQDFEIVVEDALRSVDGTLLFQMQLGEDNAAEHVAAAAIGIGDRRQFLLLTLPVGGGRLKVETAQSSANPVARIAESYAGLMDVLKVAA